LPGKNRKRKFALVTPGVQHMQGNTEQEWQFAVPRRAARSTLELSE
jgi:hypothetical protein